MVIAKLRNFNENEVQEFNRLVNELESVDKRATKLATECRTWFDKGVIYDADKAQLVKWCEASTDTRQKGRDIAKKISELIFGKVINKHD